MADKRRNHHGYVALASVLVIASVILVIGVTIALRSISEAQMAQASKRKEETVDFIEACMEDALLRLNENNAVPVTIVLPQGTCTMTSSSAGSTWTITASGTVTTGGASHTKTIQVVANRGSMVTITSWKEQ